MNVRTPMIWKNIKVSSESGVWDLMTDKSRVFPICKKFLAWPATCAATVRAGAGAEGNKYSEQSYGYNCEAFKTSVHCPPLCGVCWGFCWLGQLKLLDRGKLLNFKLKFVGWRLTTPRSACQFPDKVVRTGTGPAIRKLHRIRVDCILYDLSIMFKIHNPYYLSHSPNVHVPGLMCAGPGCDLDSAGRPGVTPSINTRPGQGRCSFSSFRWAEGAIWWSEEISRHTTCTKHSTNSYNYLITPTTLKSS